MRKARADVAAAQNESGYVSGVLAAQNADADGGGGEDGHHEGFDEHGIFLSCDGEGGRAAPAVRRE